MTAIRCPACGRATKSDGEVNRSTFEWTCGHCRQHYEVRVVFLRRPTPIDGDAFRARLQRTMDDEALSQGDVAELAGVSAAYISTVIRGKRRVSPRVAARVDDALGLGLSE